MPKPKKWIASVLIFLQGCTVGPVYEPPCTPVPCEWHSPIDGGLQCDALDCFQWWKSLNDPILNSLMERASQQNLDLYLASLRLLEARAMIRMGDAPFYPHIDGSAAYGHARFNPRVLKNVLGSNCVSRHAKNVDFYEAGFDAEWELDLFGMARHERNALRAKMEASAEDYCHIWITLAAEVARTYVELRGLQTQLAVIQKNIVAQKEALTLTHGLTTTGFASQIDLSAANEQLQELSAHEPQIQFAIDKAIHRLSIMLDKTPGELYAELFFPQPVPLLPCVKPIGVPSELLRRRPDIRRAERELAAATESVGAAVAALFPRISLRGFLGDIGTLCSTGSFTWLAGPQLLLPIFNSKLLQQDVEINKIKAEQACIVYQKTVLEALEEAENAIAAYHHELSRHHFLEKAYQSSQEAHELMHQLYEKGMRSYLDVLTLNRSMLAAEENYLQSQLQILFHYIALYKALGGGWGIEECGCP